MRQVDNECVGCPMGCINCGRKHIVHYVCDSCDADSIDSETKLYEVNGKQYCWRCAIKNNLEDFIADMTEEYGEEWVGDNFNSVNYDED